MTRDETKKILAVIAVTYPNFKAEDKTMVVNAWHMFLEDYDYKTVEAALKMYVTSSGSAFAPSVSELIAMVRKPRQLAAMEEVTAWRMVRSAIRRSLYYSHEEFDKFPKEVQEAVGDPGQLREWAMLESSEIDTVIQSNFKRRFESMQKRRTEIDAMPEEIKALIRGEHGRSQKMLSELYQHEQVDGHLHGQR